MGGGQKVLDAGQRGVVVSTIRGSASAYAPASRSPCRGSPGANSGTATSLAYIVPSIATT
ncbi:hypothetical protein ACFQQB_19870 [Nonomuraea rubra]|uniref:hypothetical protein n=1 Tax=Nonomuraea rubra TaxID=46180 RepID=UPI00361D0DBE